MTGAPTLSETIAALSGGTVSAERVVEGCLARIGKVDGDIGAWAFLDPDHALKQARALDAARADGKPVGPLHGIPVGVKDIFDTADMPTEDGTVLHAGRRPARDCTVVALLRRAGAVIMGKTVTTELAAFEPAKTRHPMDPERTPGGSSSGSAAAVASGMVPLAVGSQTNGSVIRPAAFCGVVGLKPTRGLISRRGMLNLSGTLDQVGVFAGSVADAALIGEVLADFDPAEPGMAMRARQEFARICAEEPPLPPRLAFVRSPVWEEAEADTRAAFAELVEVLGESVDAVELPSAFGEAIDLHRAIHDAELAVSLSPEYDRGRERLSAGLRGIVERGLKLPASDYIRAVARIPVLNRSLDEIFDRYDAILTPAVPGEAPPLATTGNPVFCTIWTLLGTPALTLPLLGGDDGLPIGVQLVGKTGDDARLLRTARWLTGRLAAEAG